MRVDGRYIGLKSKTDDERTDVAAVVVTGDRLRPFRNGNVDPHLLLVAYFDGKYPLSDSDTLPFPGHHALLGLDERFVQLLTRGEADFVRVPRTGEARDAVYFLDVAEGKGSPGVVADRVEAVDRAFVEDKGEEPALVVVVEAKGVGGGGDGKG